MSNRYVISDTHFSHAGMLKFIDADGNPVRAFDSVEHMDETMIDRWNATVKPNDTIYHLGDVAIPRKGLKQLAKLNGRKILIKGNHDLFKLKDYTEYFDDIRACQPYPQHGVIMTHIPIRMTGKERWQINVHGHTHSNNVGDPRWINVCVEKTNYMPVHIDVLFERAKYLVEEFNLMAS